MGKRENERAHAANGVARKPTQQLRLLTRATHCRHRIISPLDLFTPSLAFIHRKTVACLLGVFFSVYSCFLLLWCGRCLLIWQACDLHHPPL